MKLTAMRPFGLKIVGGRAFFRAGQEFDSDSYPPGTFDLMMEAGQVKASSSAPATEPEPVPPPVEETTTETTEEKE